MTLDDDSHSQHSRTFRMPMVAVRLLPSSRALLIRCLSLSSAIVSAGALRWSSAAKLAAVSSSAFLLMSMGPAPSSAALAGDGGGVIERDAEYPGTAVERLRNVHARVKSLTAEQLSADWPSVRRSLLWAGGLKDLATANPGQGYTGHSFNDYNHCDLTPMLGEVASNENEGRVAGIHQSNQLGAGIRIASLPELGPGGSWSTCMIGCNKSPPSDVAHVQFQSRIAFKLVWAPPGFDQFVLVDDAGALLASGRPTGVLPAQRERQMNYQVVAGSKYAVEADKIGAGGAARGAAASELRSM